MFSFIVEDYSDIIVPSLKYFSLSNISVRTLDFMHPINEHVFCPVTSLIFYTYLLSFYFCTFVVEPFHFSLPTVVPTFLAQSPLPYLVVLSPFYHVKNFIYHPSFYLYLFLGVGIILTSNVTKATLNMPSYHSQILSFLECCCLSSVYVFLDCFQLFCPFMIFSEHCVLTYLLFYVIFILNLSCDIHYSVHCNSLDNNKITRSNRREFKYALFTLLSYIPVYFPEYMINVFCK